MSKNYRESDQTVREMNHRKLTPIIVPKEQCNLSCTYCYNPPRSGDIMDIMTLYATLEKVLYYNGVNVTSEFILHGSEPLLAGRDFYENLVKLQKNKFSRFPVANYLQTNGLLLTPELLEFFTTNEFHLGISVDGPRYIHDRYRKDAEGKGTFSDVMRSIDLTKKAGARIGTLGVLTKSSAEHIEEVYNFFKAEKLDFDLLPFTPPAKDNTRNKELILTPKEYADAAIKLFDLWFSDPQPPGMRSCESWTLTALGATETECTYSGNCFVNYITVGPSGDVWPCNRFYKVNDFRLGNILTNSLSETIIPKAEALLSERQKKIESSCSGCDIYSACRGGCPSQAFTYTGDYRLRDHFCEAYKNILHYIKPKIKAQLEKAGARYYQSENNDAYIDFTLVEPERIQSPALRKLVYRIKEAGSVQALVDQAWRDREWRQWRDWRIFS